MQTRLVPLNAPAIFRLRQLERDFAVSFSGLQSEKLPLRRCGKRVRRISFEAQGQDADRALWEFDNWLEALGIF